MAENTKAQSAKMAKLACEALEDKKALNIRVIDISDISAIADYFIVASGTNRNQIEALVEEVEERLYKAGYSTGHKEGSSTSPWILLDFKDIIVHIFDEENRMFYNLEKIWSDGKNVEMEDL
jgi:ribosome-associated protein